MRNVGIALLLSFSFLSGVPLSAQSDVIREDDVTYATRGDLVLKLDFTRPETGEGPFPAIVYIIDDWAHQDLFLDRKSLSYDIPEAAKRGYVGVAIDRRLITITQKNKVSYPFPAELYDVKSAVRWLRSHAEQYKIDPDRIGAIGFSSGGYLALLLGLTGPADGLEGEGEDLSISRQYAIGIPLDFIDAGRIDGLSEGGIFFRVIAPLMKPAFGAMAILGALQSWNNFLWPLIVLRTGNMFTLPIGLASLLSPYGNNYDVLISGSLMATLPILVIFFVFQRYFIAGLTTGGIKG